MEIFNEKYFPSFFEHNIRFLCYSDALCIRIKRFYIKGQALNASMFFELFVKFQIKTYFSASVQRNDYIILVLAIIVVSADMKSVFGKCVNGLF